MRFQSPGNLEDEAVDPPDIVAARVDKFELEVVVGTLAANLEADAVVGGKVDGCGPADDDVAQTLGEVIVETECVAVLAGDALK